MATDHAAAVNGSNGTTAANGTGDVKGAKLPTGHEALDLAETVSDSYKRYKDEEEVVQCYGVNRHIRKNCMRKIAEFPGRRSRQAGRRGRLSLLYKYTYKLTP